MAREVAVEVEVISLDLACRACWSTVSALPYEAASTWADAHRQPRVVQGTLRIGGRLTVWRPV